MKASGPERASSWQYAVALVARSPAVALVARGEEDLDQHGLPSSPRSRLSHAEREASIERPDRSRSRLSHAVGAETHSDHPPDGPTSPVRSPHLVPACT